MSESDRQSLLTALTFVNAWSIEHDVDAWMTLASEIQSPREWEQLATSLAHLAYLLAGRVGNNENMNADQVLRELTEALGEEETDGMVS